jgi:hypothetical protein
VTNKEINLKQEALETKVKDLKETVKKLEARLPFHFLMRGRRTVLK